MDLEQIKQLAYKHLAKRKSHVEREVGYIYDHGQRVAHTAIELRKKVAPSYDKYDDVMTVAGWFHDIAKGIEPHGEYGAVLVRKILHTYCQPSELDLITKIISSHNLRKQMSDYPIYVRLIQDADILDHFGTMEIWLSFVCTAHTGGNIANVLEYYQNDYEKYIPEVRSVINFPEAVAIFDEKNEFVQMFVRRLRKEAQGKIL